MFIDITLKFIGFNMFLIISITEASDQVSSKSTVNTMYAPSSYNDTMAGETLSSLSEKSRESSYNQEDSIGEYEVVSCVPYSFNRAVLY